MKKMVLVKAGPNGPVYLPGRERQFDADGKDVNVIGDTARRLPSDSFIRDRIRMGDLVVLQEEVADDEEEG